VLAKRRKSGTWETSPRDPDPVYEDDFAGPIVARRETPEPRGAGRDEWSFPDPDEPAPTGLLPSTASARRRARSASLPSDSD
jgi:hypothetical protein